MKEKRRCEDANVDDDSSDRKSAKLDGVERHATCLEENRLTVSTKPLAPSIRAASRKTRVYIFREFVMKNYPLEPGSVVLDVAGGKGDLSWLLGNVDSLNSIVVDPRVTKADHILRSIKYLRDNPDQAKERAVPGLPSYQPLSELLPRLEGQTEFQTPRHLRLLVDDSLVHALKAYKEDLDEKKWTVYWEKATKRAKDATPLGYQESASDGSATIQEGHEALHLFLTTKLILGFHPDQATDPAIDLALLLGVPYCVVPCCVFPRENTHRKLADGSPVKKYPQLIEYLTTKYGSESAILPFHFTETAKNLALYSKVGFPRIPASSGGCNRRREA
jgi:hypothetical protein